MNKQLEVMKPESVAETETARMFDTIQRMATDPQVDPAKLGQMLAVKQNWEADEARKLFARDMARFQSECPIISKADSANGNPYAKIDRIHRETRALRRECGFWFTWSVCEIKDGLATLEGLLGHSGGHTMPVRQVIPIPDAIISRSGAKVVNETQRAGSAMSYAKRYGECLALDIVTGEDDDGNGPRPKPAGIKPMADDARALIVEIWGAMASVRGDKKDWNEANQWLYREDILDGGIPEAMPNLKPDRLRQVLAAVKEKLK